MLPKTARLNVSENFKWIMAGLRRETPHLKLFYRMGDPFGYAQDKNPSVNSGQALRPDVSGSGRAVRLRSPQVPFARVGVAVSSKEFKKAHLRVKAKRMCYTAVGLVYNDLPERLNLVIMPKPSILESVPVELVKELNGKFTGESN